MYDRDVNQDDALKYPEVYKKTQSG